MRARLFSADSAGIGETEPPDHPVVHLIWEVVLLVVAGVFVLVAVAGSHGASLAEIFGPVGYVGLIATGLALSLRTGTPNLAVGNFALFTGVIGVHLVTADGWSLWSAMTLAVVITVLIGLVTGVLVAVLSVPAWALTLGIAFLLQSASLGIIGSAGEELRHPGTYSTALWFVAFVVISAGGGVLWLSPAVRTLFSASRSASEPGQWAGLPAGLGAVVGLTGSSLLAGVGGVALALFQRFADPASDGVGLTAVAMAAVLVGGVSIFGRRAGVAGTILGVIIAESLNVILLVNNFSSSWYYVPFGLMIVFGLGVNRALESITDLVNRRRVPSFTAPSVPA
jgi:ribose/xylose/arabinose/galactoside ABC-type transport system permease subunit